MDVASIDYGVGNLRSLRRGLERAGATVTVSDDPGKLAAEDTPILGTCVGLQLLFTESTEGVPERETIDGLDLLPGRVERLPSESVAVPHMGWNELAIERDHPLVAGIDEGDYGFEFAANEAGNVVGT